MSKKDYIAIASAISQTDGLADGNSPDFFDGVEMARRTIAERLADGFAQDNPRFNRARFLKACGV